MEFTTYLTWLLEAFFAILILGGAAAIVTSWISQSVHHEEKPQFQGPSTTMYTSDRER